MRIIPDDHISKESVFEFDFPESGVHWPLAPTGEAACIVCQAASTRRVKIEGSDVVGAAAAALAPVSVRRIRSVEVPMCAQHDYGADLTVSGSDVTLRFRSYAYWKRIVAANPANA